MAMTGSAVMYRTVRKTAASGPKDVLLRYLNMSIKLPAVQVALNECRFDRTESTGAF